MAHRVVGVVPRQPRGLSVRRVKDKGLLELGVRRCPVIVIERHQCISHSATHTFMADTFDYPVVISDTLILGAGGGGDSQSGEGEEVRHRHIPGLGGLGRGVGLPLSLRLYLFELVVDGGHPRPDGLGQARQGDVVEGVRGRC